MFRLPLGSWDVLLCSRRDRRSLFTWLFPLAPSHASDYKTMTTPMTQDDFNHLTSQLTARLHRTSAIYGIALRLRASASVSVSVSVSIAVSASRSVSRPRPPPSASVSVLVYAGSSVVGRVGVRWASRTRGWVARAHFKHRWWLRCGGGAWCALRALAGLELRCRRPPRHR